jgi:hypothetical protein
VALFTIVAASGILFSFVAQQLSLLNGLIILLGVASFAVVLSPLLTAVRNLGVLRKNLTWWHGLWLLLFLSSLVYRVPDSVTTSFDVWRVLRVALVGIVSLVLVAHLAVGRTLWMRSLFQGIVGALSVYVLVCAVSTLWSLNPTWTLYHSLEYLVDVASLAAILATIRSAEEYETFFNCTWLLYGLLLAWTWVGALLWPEEALHPATGRTGGFALYGIFPHLDANAVGVIAAMLAVVALSRLLGVRTRNSERGWHILLFLFGVTTMVVSQTRSAMGGFLLAVFLVFTFSGRARTLALLTLLVTPLLAFTQVGGLVWEFLKREQTEQELAGFTGRLDWWTVAWHRFLEHPLTGLGAYAGSKFGVMAENLGVNTGTLHSDYVEIIVGTSFWGLIPIFITLLATAWLLIRYLRGTSLRPLERQLAVEALGLLGLLVVCSLFGALLSFHAPLQFLAVVGYAEFLRRRRHLPYAPVPQPRFAFPECAQENRNEPAVFTRSDMRP